MEKITELATTLINGNISDFKDRVQDLNRVEFLNLIEEYNLLKGSSYEETIRYFKRIL